MKIRLFLLSLLFLYTQVFAFDVDELLDVRDVPNEKKTAQVEEVVTIESQEYETNTGFNIIEFLNFESDCYITQDEDSHNTRKWGSMFALDVSCKDKSFMIARVPQYITGGYYVGRVWIDKYLWDYITLNFWDGYTLVYGHTENIYNLKEWDRLTKWMAIGKANISGKSSWLHFHTELWKWGKNITFDLLRENEKSDKLRYQRWRMSKQEESEFDTTLNNIEIDFEEIKDVAFRLLRREGNHNKAYRDIKWWSICRWSRSYEGEVLTDEQCEEKTKLWLTNWVEKVTNDFDWLNNNQYWALVSMRWNCHSVYNLLRKEWISESLRKSCRTAGGKVMKWLELRRNDEWNTFIK